MTKIDSGDLARRVLHTFLQSFLAVLAVSYAASGLNVSQINDEASAKKFALAVVAAVVAAALSALKTTLVSLFTPSATLGRNGSSGTGPVPDEPSAAATSTPREPMPGPGVTAAAGRHEAPDTTEMPAAAAE